MYGSAYTGFHNLELNIWEGPILLGCALKRSEEDNIQQLPRHGDEDQVQLDVDRSFVYYPEGSYRDPWK